mgnify:CR=1 FL=1
MSVREHWINVRVNPEELARIREKQKELGIRNTGAYMRKMAMDGYCVNLDLSDVAQVSTLLRRCSNNLNQYAKRANETGSIYRADIEDLQKRAGGDLDGHERSSCSPVLNPVIRQLVGKSQFRLRLLHKG